MNSKTFAATLDKLIERYSFIKGIIITDVDGAEVMKIINVKSELNTSSDIRVDAIEMAYSTVYQSAKEQIAKLEQCEFESIMVVHNDVVIEQRMLGLKTLLTMICDVNSNYGLIPIVIEDIKTNFKLLDMIIDKVQSNYGNL
eukprot:TRINITY_DN6869_c0_g1_i2.p2 TRINITY_DN6869_c0_g1~~TRINITY_DN6869_c0_g1_i2.p2  ORF type:complete len:142 (-),score=60.80 TRINITY_DN6869_c0_g1_i2:497-922(-)